MNTLDIEKLRKDTPGCQNILHFNNAGASLSPTPVVNAVKAYLDLETTTGGYEAAQAEAATIEKFYDHAAALINCSRDEIAFVENATRGFDMAFYSFKFKKGDRIITALCEYASNYLAFLHAAKHTGVTIDVIRNDESGQLDIDDLQKKLDNNVKLIAITHVPSQGGLVNPAEEVGKIANKWNIPYILDATQSVGQMPIDVQAIGCDFLCTTGRKYLRGPRGTGFLYARKSIIEQSDPPFIDLHAATWTKDDAYELRTDARRFETWEQNIAAKIGLSKALRYAHEIGLPNIRYRIQHLADYLRTKLTEIPGIDVCDLGKTKCGIVTFTCKNKSAQAVQQALAKHKINVSVSLQEYARLDLAKRHLDALVRASVHYYNTEDEVDRFCQTLHNVIKAL